MTRTLFCLSMPGGHMSYIATLAACLLGRIQPDRSYITPRGSSHGANHYFPVELYNMPDADGKPMDLTIEDWDAWHKQALREYAHDGICIAKDGWVKLGRGSWEQCVDSVNSVAIVSHCDDPIDWYYAWFNMVDKIPKHIYYRLRQRSILYPKLWNRLNKRKKIAEMTAAMPIYPLGDSPRFESPSLYFPATDILEKSFPEKISAFLDSQNIKTDLSKDIMHWHNIFIAKQQINLMKARLLAKGERWHPQGPYDEILFGWLDTVNHLS